MPALPTHTVNAGGHLEVLVHISATSPACWPRGLSQAPYLLGPHFPHVKNEGCCKAERRHCIEITGRAAGPRSCSVRLAIITMGFFASSIRAIHSYSHQSQTLVLVSSDGFHRLCESLQTVCKLQACVLLHFALCPCLVFIANL